MSGAGRSRRERLALRLPRPLIEFPFEVLVCLFGVLASVAVAFFGKAPGSLRETLPAVVIHLWAASLLLGSVTTGLGITKRFRRLLASGLQMSGVGLTVYIVALAATNGARSTVGILALSALVCIAFLRALYVSASTDLAGRLEARRKERDS